MKFSRISFAVAALLAATIGFTSANVAEAAPKVLKIASQQPKSGAYIKLFEEHFIKKIEATGNWKVQFYPGGALGNNITCLDGLALGTIQMYLDSCSNVSQRVPELAVFEIPFMLRDGYWEKFRNSEVSQELAKACEKKGIRMLSFRPASNRNLISRKPIQSAEDIKGMKIRCTSSKFHIAGLTALGFKPIPMASSEMLTGIQQGVVDCMDINLMSMVSQRIADVAKNVIITNQTKIMDCNIASKEWWDTLDAADQKLISGLLDEWVAIWLKEESRITNETIEKLKSMKCNVTTMPEAEVAKLRKAAKGISGSLPPETRAIYEKLTSL